jgi:hypothetical protein
MRLDVWRKLEYVLNLRVNLLWKDTVNGLTRFGNSDRGGMFFLHQGTHFYLVPWEVKAVVSQADHHLHVRSDGVLPPHLRLCTWHKKTYFPRRMLSLLCQLYVVLSLILITICLVFAHTSYHVGVIHGIKYSLEINVCASCPHTFVLIH